MNSGYSYRKEYPSQLKNAPLFIFCLETKSPFEFQILLNLRDFSVLNHSACIYTSIASYFVLYLNNDRVAYITKDLTPKNADC